MVSFLFSMFLHKHFINCSHKYFLIILEDTIIARFNLMESHNQHILSIFWHEFHWIIRENIEILSYIHNRAVNFESGLGHVFLFSIVHLNVWRICIDIGTKKSGSLMVSLTMKSDYFPYRWKDTRLSRLKEYCRICNRASSSFSYFNCTSALSKIIKLKMAFPFDFLLVRCRMFNGIFVYFKTRRYTLYWNNVHNETWM